jgi:hypothetical protein
MSHRADVNAALHSWRDAERRLRKAEPGSAEQASAIADMRTARRAYEAIIVADGARGARRPTR